MTKQGKKKAIDIIPTPTETMLTEQGNGGIAPGLSNALTCSGGRPVDNKKRLIYDNFRRQGYSVNEAANLAGYNSSYARLLEAKGKKGLLSPLVPSAKRAIKDTIKGRKVGDAQIPRASDVLRAAELVLEREAPIVHHVDSRNLSVNIELTEEERQRFKEMIREGRE